MNLANRSSWICAALFTLAACGGGSSLDGDDNGSGSGGSGGGSGGTTTPAATLALKVEAFRCPDDVAPGTVVGCEPTEKVTPTLPARLRSTLSVASGSFDVANRPIVVTAPQGLMNPLSGQTTTDSKGAAYLDLSAGNTLEVTDTITASYAQTVDGNAYSVSATTAVRYVQMIVDSLALTLTSPNWDLATPLADGSSIPVVATVTINGTQPTVPVDVTFSTSCAAKTPAQAEIDVTVATNSSGVATSAYKLAGCKGQDVINASVNAGGLSATKTLTVTVREEPAGAIQFVSASKEYLCLVGTGCDNSSILTFKVVDVLGNAKSGAEVNFDLLFNGIASDSRKEGLAVINPLKATTNNNGEAVVTVTAGNLPVSPRVKASTQVTPDEGAAYAITAVSSQLGIGTGLPHINGFSIAVEKFNLEGGNIDGVSTTITARLADHFGNPVPDGTSVTFISPESGIIAGGNQANCTTAAGKCSVVWESAGDRPADNRVTILAYVTGEDSFQDRDGNGLFNEGDIHLSDVAEPFVNANECYVEQASQVSGVASDACTGVGVASGYTSGVIPVFTSDFPGEQLIDDDQNGEFTPANGIYDGMLCADSDNGVACNRRQVQISKEAVLALSKDSNLEMFVCADASCSAPLVGNTVPAGQVTVCVYSPALDGTLNPAPFGTDITFKAESPLKIAGRSSFAQGNTSTPIKVPAGAASPALSLAESGCAAGRQVVTVEHDESDTVSCNEPADKQPKLGSLTIEATFGANGYASVPLNVQAKCKAD